MNSLTDVSQNTQKKEHISDEDTRLKSKNRELDHKIKILSHNEKSYLQSKNDLEESFFEKLRNKKYTDNTVRSVPIITKNSNKHSELKNYQ